MSPKYLAILRSGTALALCAMAAGAVAGPAFAADPVPAAPHVLAPEGADAQVRAFWTPDRIKNAKTLDLVVPGSPKAGHLPKRQNGPRQTTGGVAPTEQYDFSLAARLYDEDGLQKKSPNLQPQLQPLVGTSGLPYTTNRLYPRSVTDLYTAYPYATVGHLYFTINGAGYQCSASVIRRNVIATAGHCVNNGSGTYYANWLFIPAQNGSLAPFGSWTWADADTTSAWYSGGGGVPNPQDDAVIVLNQQTYKGALHSVGDLTGYLGYEYNAPLPTTITQLGYPCNLDGCGDPVATYAQDTSGPSNNFQWGTDSFGGASGGPEIQDFGQAPTGAPSEPYGGNILISSTSYTYSTAYQVDGGSILWAPGQNGQWTFGNLITWACGFPNAC